MRSKSPAACNILAVIFAFGRPRPTVACKIRSSAGIDLCSRDEEVVTMFMQEHFENYLPTRTSEMACSWCYDGRSDVTRLIREHEGDGIP